jgi:ABC-type Co2+ transport system permease subunit
MHIPDGYLGPATSGVFCAVMVPLSPLRMTCISSKTLPTKSTFWGKTNG